MNIVYIVENYGAISETFVSKLILNLANKGNKLSVIVDKILFTTKDNNFQIIETKYNSTFNKSVFWLSYILKILLRKDFYFLFKRKIADYRIKEYLLKIQPDVIYIEYGNNAVLVSNIIEALQIPYIVHYHGRDVTSLTNNIEYTKLLKMIFMNSNRSISCSNYISRRLDLLGCPNKKNLTVYNSVEIPEKIRPNNKSPHPSLIFIGRLVNKKNPFALIKAFSLVLLKFPDTILTIIGNGPLYSKVIEYINDLGIKNNIILLGSKPHKEALEILAANWIYVQHSVTAYNGDEEGFPTTILEAMSYGLPVVSTIHSGITEQIMDGQNGYLVQEYDFESMARKIIFLLNNQNKIRELGENGREVVSNKYSMRNRVDKINNILNNCVKDVSK